MSTLTHSRRAPLPASGQTVKIMANSDASFLRMDMVAGLDDVILMTGMASESFTAAGADGEGAVFFEEAESSDPRLPFRFLLCLKPGAAGECSFSFPSLRASQTFFIEPGRLSPDLAAFGQFVMPKAVWPILRQLGLFSNAWHRFAAVLPLRTLNEIPERGLSFAERVTLEQLREILPNYDPSGWQGALDGYNAAHVTGWAKKSDSAATQSVDLCLNGVAIRKGLTAGHFRADVLEAGIGTGRYGLRESVPQAPEAGDLLAFSLRDPQSGKIFAFRFYQYPFTGAQYEVFLEYAHPELKGWAIARDMPDRIFNLDIFIDGAFFGAVQNSEQRGDLKKRDKTSGLGGFRIASPAGLLAPGEHNIEIYAGGRKQAQHIHVSAGRMPAPIADLSILDRPVAIIIPFYEDPLLEDCLASLFAHTPATARVIIVDDCSPNIHAEDILARFQPAHNVEVLRNRENLGFPGTVNAGMAMAGSLDVILLNSDTRVTRGWYRSMLLAAASQTRVATVTPMSDRAGAFSAPRMGNSNPLPPGCSPEEFARAFRRSSFGLRPEIPSGHGFCMYISRACLDEIGDMDAGTFGRLYGEENDFCMRALRAGWKHLLDDSSYIFHNRPENFAEFRRDLMERARKTIDGRYPEYSDAIRIFREGRDLKFARFAASLAGVHHRRLSRTRVLYVIGVDDGGTPQSNLDLMRQIRESAEVYLLVCDTRVMRLYILDGQAPRQLYEHRLESQLEGRSHVSPEYDAVAAGWIHALDIDIVHIRQLIWQSLNLIPTAKKLGCKIVYSFHDFYALNPNLNLIDDTGVFRGGDYIEDASPYRVNIWHRSSCAPAPVHEAGFLKFWKDRFYKYLRQCDAYVTTSGASKKIIIEEMPGLPEDRIAVIPHGRNFEIACNCNAFPRPWDQIRLLAPGNIDWHKGRGLIETLAEYDAKHADRLKFHIAGRWRGWTSDKIIAEGEYRREDFRNIAARVAPHAGLILSLWSETWCHTLTELWACGIPVIALDFGTQADRIRQSGAGWTLAGDMDIPELYESILAIMDDPAGMRKALDAVASWQGNEAIANNTQLMGARYYRLYSNILNNEHPLKRRDMIAVCAKHGLGTSHLRTIGPCANDYKRDPVYLLCHGAQLRAYAALNLVDGAIIQRNCLHRSFVRHTVEALQANGIPWSYEMDDDLFHVSEKNGATYKEYQPCMRQMMAGASKITLSTPELYARYVSEYPTAMFVQSKLDRAYWGAQPKPRIEDGMIRALYHGTPTHAEDLLEIMPQLKEIAARYPEFRLALMRLNEGAEEIIAGCEFVEIIDIDSKSRPYPPFTRKLHEIAPTIDFGLAPLADNYFNRGKSFNKVIEFAALGLPAIASNITPYKELAGFPGLALADNTHSAWVSALEQKIGRGRRNRVDGKAAFEHAVANYMLDEASLAEFDRRAAPRGGNGK